MDPSPTPQDQRDQRNRRACEACRRKKTKCTAERPICSFCRRLNQQCVYLPRDHAKTAGTPKRISKTQRKPTSDRFHALEAQVNDIYRIIHSFSNPYADVDSTSPTATASNRESDQGLFASGLNVLDPPSSVLNHFINVYRRKLHLQPLPLFNSEDIQKWLTASPKFLLWSFLALTLNFSSHDFYPKDKESDFSTLYTRSAEESLLSLAVEGTPRVEVVQALCLLAVRHIAAKQPSRAWMTIGTASRLEALRRLTLHDLSTPEHNGQDMDSRCYWSVFMLERIFCPRLPGLPDAETVYPRSASVPPPAASGRERIPADLFNSEEVTGDIGIGAYCIRRTSHWAKIASYLHELRSGNVETPWSSDSTYAKLNTEFHELEAQFAPKHLLRNVSFSKRSRAELLEQQEYWYPWMSMQILAHGSPALLNHPFINLVAMRGNRGVAQSRIWLQQAVDQALYHSGWVFRLIQTCEDLSFEINDPMIGHLVAATATIPWLFQFVRDNKVSTKAKEDLGTSERFLRRLSATWPHILQKLEILQTLQSIAIDKQRDTPDKDITITFQPSLFWELLDPKICQMTPIDSTSTGDIMTPSTEPSPDTRVRVTTHFVHPLDDPQAEPALPAHSPFYSRRNSGPNVTDTVLRSAEEFERVSMDEMFYQFAPGNWNWP